jgi:hypothetical protein
MFFFTFQLLFTLLEFNCLLTIQDTVYFHLPALHNPRQTVFGISCYRQIDSDMVSYFLNTRNVIFYLFFILAFYRKYRINWKRTLSSQSVW